MAETGYRTLVEAVGACDAAGLEPSCIEDRGGRFHLPASSTTGSIYKSEHVEVLAHPKGTRFGGLDFELLLNGTAFDCAKTAAAAKTKARAIERKYPQKGSWYRTPTSAYGKVGKREQALVVEAKGDGARFRLWAPGSAGHGREFTLPVALVVSEASRVKTPPKGSRGF